MTEEEYTPAWNLRSMVDAYTERPPTEYIVDKFLPTHSLTIFFGVPGGFKSLVLADLCAHVAAGSWWLPGGGDGGNGIPVQQAPVLWLDMDNGTRRTDARFDAIGRAVGLTEDAPLFYISMPNPPLIAHDIDSMMLLKTTILETGAQVVVIDNLGLMTGDVEENSAMMSIVMGNLRQIAESTGAAIVIIHHQRKGGANGGRAGDSLRGHSSIEAALDLAVLVVREPDGEIVTLRPTKTRDVPPPVVSARFDYEHIPGTNDLRKASFEGIPARRGENAIRDEIISIVEHYGTIGKKKLAEKVKENMGLDAPGINKIRAWIDDMISSTGELEETKQGTYRNITLGENI